MKDDYFIKCSGPDSLVKSHTGSRCQTPRLHQRLRSGTSKANLWFWLFLFVALIFGTFLRLYLIADQILLDDEWHGFDYVIGRSLVYLFTHSGSGATCIPLNLYRWFLLQTLGWSELWLRLPMLSAGVLCLLVFPLFLPKVISRRATIIFAFLLAISPFLTFYSRVCRPYSIVVFVGFVSVMALYFWATTGRRTYGFTYVVTAVLVIYFHLFSAIVVLTPLAYLILRQVMNNLHGFPGQKVCIVPTLGVLHGAAAWFGLLSSLLIVPALIQSGLPTQFGVGQLTYRSLASFLSMLSGSSNKFMTVSYVALFVLGLIALMRQTPLLGHMFLAIVTLNFAVLLIFRPLSAHSAIVISRYTIVVFPLFMMSAALGIDGILQYFWGLEFVQRWPGRSATSNLMAATFVLMLFLSGPLSEIYVFPNNFTNHSAFQESYASIDWNRSYTSDFISDRFVVSRDDVSDFYRFIASDPDTDGIIEYPMMIGDHLNLYYYYQHFHRKEVLIGYTTQSVLDDDASHQLVGGNRTANDILGRVPYTSKLKFRNMIDVTDIVALRQTDCDYIVLHKNLFVEMGQPSLHEFDFALRGLEKPYRKFFGEPVFEDQNLQVFRIRSASPR